LPEEEWYKGNNRLVINHRVKKESWSKPNGCWSGKDAGNPHLV